MGLGLIMQTKPLLTRSCVKRPSIVPSAIYAMNHFPLVRSLLQGRTSGEGVL